MATPDYESIFAAVQTIIQGITADNGYVTNLDPTAVKRRLLTWGEIEAFGLYPLVMVVRPPVEEQRQQGSGRSEIGKVESWMPIECLCVTTCDQSVTDTVPDTVLNVLQNDIQTRIVSQFATLQAVGALDVRFTRGVLFAYEPGSTGQIYTVMDYIFDIHHFIPIEGY